jgi:hypothetical protein
MNGEILYHRSSMRKNHFLQIIQSNKSQKNKSTFLSFFSSSDQQRIVLTRKNVEFFIFYLYSEVVNLMGEEKNIEKENLQL